MELRIELDSNIIFMKMSGSLVASTVEEIKTQIQKLVAKKYMYIVFDLSGVDFVDSSGLGLCIATSRELSGYSGRLVCSGLRDNVQKLFSMTRADQKIKVVPSRMDAFNFLQEQISEASRSKSAYPL